MYPNTLIFLSPLSTLYKALFPHAFSYPDPPLPNPILELGELQRTCSSRLVIPSPSDPILWLHFWERLKTWKITLLIEGVLQDKEVFNLASTTLVSLHFAVWVVQQTHINLSPGQMLYLYQHLISPYIINPESTRKVTRIKETITNWRSSWLLNKLFLYK